MVFVLVALNRYWRKPRVEKRRQERLSREV